jgi:hypothetical protein
MRVIEDCGKGLFALLPKLAAELSPDEFKRVKREIARVVTTMDESLSAKVAAEYPELAPEAVPHSPQTLGSPYGCKLIC